MLFTPNHSKLWISHKNIYKTVHCLRGKEKPCYYISLQCRICLNFLPTARQTYQSKV